MENFVLHAVVVTIMLAVDTTRSDNGLPTLKQNRPLMDAACEHAYYMARTGDFSHGDVQGRAAKAGYKGLVWENIAYGGDPVDSWLDSPAHLQNILANAKDIGVACAVDKNGKHYYVLVIGRPTDG